MKEIDHLEEIIRKTGYPLEIEISSMLDDKWSVTNTDSFFDRDEGKLRDVDITAWKTLPEKWLPIFGDMGLVIECKKDDNFAWVFFTRPFEFNWREGHIDGQYLDQIQILTKNFEAEQIREIILKKTKFHYENIKRVAVSFTQIFRKGKKDTFEQKKKDIFEGENQQKKYISYYFEQCVKARYDICRIEMMCPIMVFDGKMYEVVIKKDEIKVSETNHVVLPTVFRNPYSIFEQSLLIDIIRKDHFPNFLKVLEDDAKSFRTAIRKNKRRIEQEVEKAQLLLRSAKSP